MKNTILFVNKQVFLLVCSLLFSSTIALGQTITVPDSIKALRSARLIETVKDEKTKVPRSATTRVYCFDSNKNITHTFDERGLYFSYEFDSLNNLVTEYFFEKIDPLTNKRIPSGKWVYTYSNNLRVKIYLYDFVNGNWKMEDSLWNTYRLDKYGRIIQNDYFVGNELKSTVRYSYTSKPATKQTTYDFNRGWLDNHTCSKAIERSASGRILEVTTYEYDSVGKCIKTLRQDYFNPSELITETEYVYSSTGLLLEETERNHKSEENQNEHYLRQRYEYDDQGFIIKYRWDGSDAIETVKIYDYFKM